MRVIDLLTRTLSALLVVTLLIGTPVTTKGNSFDERADMAVMLHNSGDVKAEFEFNLSGLDHQKVLVNSTTYDKFSIDGEAQAGKEGFPEFPLIVRNVLIPPQSGVALRIKDVKFRTISNVNPYPRQAESNTADASFNQFSGSINDLVAAEAVSEVDGYWPDQIAELGTPSVMRGYRLVPVMIHPLRWNQATGELQIIEHFEVELDFTSDENRINLVSNSSERYRSDMVDRILNQLVINPPTPRRDDIHPTNKNRGSIVYVIGTGNTWNPIVNILEPLVEWRRRMGWNVEILRTDVSDRIDIRDALIDMYENDEVPPEYIVLVGDAPHLAGNNFTIAYWDARNGPAYPYESDFNYGQLEGDDYLPEAAVGRLIFNSTGMLEDQLPKIINYESDPYLGENEDEAGWWLRAAGAATDYQSGISSIDVCLWFKDLIVGQHGFEEFGEYYWGRNGLGQQPNPTNFISEQFSNGISFMIYRGWTNMNGYAHDSVNGLRNGRMLPFVVLATCNTGDYGENVYNPFASYAERFSYHPGGGAIGCIGAAGATHTAYNNIYASSTLLAPFALDVTTQGWAAMNGRIALWNHYADYDDINHEENSGMEAWLTEFYIYNLMGDPAVDLYTAKPIMLEVTHSDIIRRGETKFEARVEYVGEDENTPASDVQVCLYKPGDDGFQIVEFTDAQGYVTFNMDPEMTLDGEIQLTVTGHNLFPYLHDFEIQAADNFIGASTFEIDDDNNGESRGDGDGIANPTERLELTIDITNLGENNVQGAMQARLIRQSPLLDVVQGEADFNNVPAPGQSVQGNFIVEIGGGVHNGEYADFTLEVSAGENEWISSVAIPVEAAKPRFVSYRWAGDPLHRADDANLYITIRNEGTKTTGALSAVLFSNTATVEASVPEGSFASLQPTNEGESEEVFTVSAHPFHMGSQMAYMGLALSNEAGFVDTTYFSFRVADAVQGEPFGPDNYGYICFDNTDTSWFACPTFNWVEIDTSEDGPGTDTGLDDTGESRDESILIDLPFTFQYYGVDYDQATICTNGWVAMGNHSELLGGRNRKIPGGEVISGMICPFWDDLITTNAGGIFTWYDEENHYFVIEWSKMRRLGPAGNNEAMETFEVILYDPENWPSFTGDADIVFQYLDVTDARSCYQTWDTPYATVGIGSPSQNDGLQYTYGGQLTPGAARLVDSTAIKFTTLIEFDLGYSRGIVLDARSGEPISDVYVRTSYGFNATTREDGTYFIDDMLADNERPYEYTFHKAGYNDSTITDIYIFKAETTEVNVSLLHPEFVTDVPDDRLLFILNQDNDYQDDFTLTNSGNGTLWYTSRFNYILDGRQDTPRRDEMWDKLLSWNVTDSTSLFYADSENWEGDGRINSVVLAGDMWYVTGSNNNDEGNFFYLFDKNGNMVDTIRQQCDENYGITDMEYYDGYIYATASSSVVYKMDPEDGSILGSYSNTARMSNIRCITINPENGHFYLASITNQICEMELDNDTLRTVTSFPNPLDPRDGQSLRRYGFGYFRDDPDHFNLYIISNKDYWSSPDLPDVSLFKMNTTTGEVRYLTNLPTADASDESKGGICITSKWNNMVWVLASVLDHTDGDKVSVFELGPNASWLTYSPRSDTLYAQEAKSIGLSINTTDLDLGDYGVVLEFSHNAAGGMKAIRIDLRITDEISPYDDNETVPLAFNLEQNWPNPFNMTTNLKFSLEQTGFARLAIYDINGREISVLHEGETQAGRYTVSFKAPELPSGVYFYRLESLGNVATRKMVLLK